MRISWKRRRYGRLVEIQKRKIARAEHRGHEIDCGGRCATTRSGPKTKGTARNYHVRASDGDLDRGLHLGAEGASAEVCARVFGRGETERSECAQLQKLGVSAKYLAGPRDMCRMRVQAQERSERKNEDTRIEADAHCEKFAWRAWLEALRI